MAKVIKMDKEPGEFKCRTCQTTWSSFMANNNPCTDTSERYGLHDFDFKKPLV